VDHLHLKPHNQASIQVMVVTIICRIVVLRMLDGNPNYLIVVVHRTLTSMNKFSDDFIVGIVCIAIKVG
jgi:hypothetical protein